MFLSKHTYFIVAIVLCICSATSCKKDPNFSDNVSKNSTNESEQSPYSVAQSYAESEDINLSPEAKEIALLIDNKSYTAADTLFNNYFPIKINDATLYSQYVRFLILSREINDLSPIESPIKKPGDPYFRVAILRLAITLAIQFDQSLKKYLSNLILKSFYEKLNETANSGSGYMLARKDFLFQKLSSDAFEVNVINIAWFAIELDAAGSKAWAAKYESLVPIFIQNGKSHSAMMTANLAGDLATEAAGDADFEKATDAFLSSIKSQKSQKDTIESTAEHYVELFTEECKQSLRNRDMKYIELINAIKLTGASLKNFEENNLLPF